MAFNTVSNYDLYQSYLVPGSSDAHYLHDWPATDHCRHIAQRGGGVSGDALRQHMDMLQLIFSFVNAPLFATFLLACSGSARPDTRRSGGWSPGRSPRPATMRSPRSPEAGR